MDLPRVGQCHHPRAAHRGAQERVEGGAGVGLIEGQGEGAEFGRGGFLRGGGSKVGVLRGDFGEVFAVDERPHPQRVRGAARHGPSAGQAHPRGVGGAKEGLAREGGPKGLVYGRGVGHGLAFQEARGRAALAHRVHRARCWHEARLGDRGTPCPVVKRAGDREAARVGSVGGWCGVGHVCESPRQMRRASSGAAEGDVARGEEGNKGREWMVMQRGPEGGVARGDEGLSCRRRCARVGPSSRAWDQVTREVLDEGVEVQVLKIGKVASGG